MYSLRENMLAAFLGIAFLLRNQECGITPTEPCEQPPPPTSGVEILHKGTGPCVSERSCELFKGQLISPINPRSYGMNKEGEDKQSPEGNQIANP